jgi:hypothetical protein
MPIPSALHQLRLPRLPLLLLLLLVRLQPLLLRTPIPSALLRPPLLLPPWPLVRETPRWEPCFA